MSEVKPLDMLGSIESLTFNLKEVSYERLCLLESLYMGLISINPTNKPLEDKLLDIIDERVIRIKASNKIQQVIKP